MKNKELEIIYWPRSLEKVNFGRPKSINNDICSCYLSGDKSDHIIFIDLRHTSHKKRKTPATFCMTNQFSLLPFERQLATFRETKMLITPNNH